MTQIRLPGGSASLSYTPDNRLKHVDAQDEGPAILQAHCMQTTGPPLAPAKR